MDCKQQRVGSLRGLARCAGPRVALGLPRQRLELLLTAGVAENHLVTGSGEQRPELSAHQAGTENTDAHVPGGLPRKFTRMCFRLAPARTPRAARCRGKARRGPRHLSGRGSGAGLAHELGEDRLVLAFRAHQHLAAIGRQGKSGIAGCALAARAFGEGVTECNTHLPRSLTCARRGWVEKNTGQLETHTASQDCATNLALSSADSFSRAG